MNGELAQATAIESLNEEVERVIRQSEVMAVVAAQRRGSAIRVGDILDYCIQATSKNRKSDRYRFTVEQWHLDSAGLLSLDEALNYKPLP
jgi:hypothetical protein